MIIRNLKEIQKMCGGSNLAKKYEDLSINGVSIDSRNIEKNQLFIPLSGDKFNGHEFLDKAIENGALASLWNKDEALPKVDFPLILVEDTLLALQSLARSYRLEVNPKVVGITGSNGKTSTKDILASLLASQYKTHKTLGNFNNHIGLPLTILNMDEDVEMAVLEIGISDFGEASLLTSIAKPNLALVTNIGEAHLEDLKTRENIVRAKLEILEGLDSEGLFIYPGDEEILKDKIKSIEKKFKTMSFGSSDFNDFQYEKISLDEKGSFFTLKNIESPDFFLPMLGSHQISNSTAAILVARYFNISFDNIKKALLNVDKTKMRSELIRGKGFSLINDSYNSNPTSLSAALETLYSMEAYDQKIIILGDMLGLGEDNIKMHKYIGSKIDKNQVAYLFTLGPLSRHLADEAKLNLGDDRVFSYDSKDKVKDHIRRIIKKNSLILVKASRAFGLEELVFTLKEEDFFN